MKVGIVGMPNAGKSSLFTALTGVAAFAGSAIQQGMQVATDEVNSTKFLGGATLQVTYGDIGSTPQQASCSSDTAS